MAGLLGWRGEVHCTPAAVNGRRGHPPWRRPPVGVQMYSMSELSPRRAAVLAFIRERVEEEGRPPSLAEIAQACGLASRGAARKHVLALAEAGLVEVAAGQARGVRPAGPRARPALLQVPVLGRVAAGAPLGAAA